MSIYPRKVGPVYVLTEEVWTEDGQEHIVHGVYSSLALAEAAIEHLMQETKRVKKTHAGGVLRHRLSDFEIHDYQVTTSADEFPALSHLEQAGD